MTQLQVPQRRNRLVAVAVALFVVGVIASGLGMIPMFRSIATPEALLPADGAPHAIATQPGGRHMLWVGNSSPHTPACTAINAGSGDTLDLEPVLRYHHEGTSAYLRSVARFEARSMTTTIACAGPRQSVYVTVAYDGTWALAHLAPVFLPFVLFTAAGVVCLWLGLRRRPQG